MRYKVGRVVTVRLIISQRFGPPLGGLVLTPCQACRSAPASYLVPDDDPDQPYLLCPDCYDRTAHFSLRPREWFHLASVHGPLKHHLHDDFYDDNGCACQPAKPVVDAELFPYPAMGEWTRSVDFALDVAFSKWQLPQPLRTYFTQNADATLTALQRAVHERPNVDIEIRAYEIVADLGSIGANWLRERWPLHRPESLGALSEASSTCLSSDEGLQLVAAAVHARESELPQIVACLAWFHSEAALDVFSKLVRPPLTRQWGETAACIGLRWSVVSAWLDRGRPWSLIALDALKACVDDSPRLRRMQPLLLEPPPASELTTTLSTYAKRDKAPRVRLAVDALVKKADRLCRAIGH